MMVTFVSQCEKKALHKTRRVLDSFANRIGDNTWQTIITNEGLNAVKKLLRKTASKNTAVSCHWSRGRNRSELVWIVGNRNKFNAQGIVPVHYTRKDIVNTHKPGYEQEDSLFSTHDLGQLIEPHVLRDGINAVPRIQRGKNLNHKDNFAEMEHYSISKILTAWKINAMDSLVGPERLQGWLTQCWWLTAYPQKYNRFRNSSLTQLLSRPH